MTRLPRILLAWLPLGVAITLVCGLIYATVQQNYRQSLNDPQIQMAEDAAARLASGEKPDQVVTDQNVVDVTNSLAPWLAVYTEDGVGIVSSGQANGEIPALPHDVFATSTWKQYAEDRISMEIPSNETRFTWQSGAGVREALVLVHYTSPKDSGFVVAGRNMREVESRESALTRMVGIGWLVTMIASLGAQALVQFL